MVAYNVVIQLHALYAFYNLFKNLNNHQVHFFGISKNLKNPDISLKTYLVQMCIYNEWTVAHAYDQNYKYWTQEIIWLTVNFVPMDPN